MATKRTQVTPIHAIFAVGGCGTKPLLGLDKHQGTVKLRGFQAIVDARQERC
jgi:hypothetical protein